MPRDSVTRRSATRRAAAARICAALAVATAAACLAGGAAARPERSAATGLVVWGHGFGHGIGLSQWGAEGRALAGQDYRRILSFYYPGTELGQTRGRTVRVLVRENPVLSVGSSSAYTATDAAGRRYRLAPGRLRVTANRLGAHPVTLPLVVRPGAAPLRLGGTGYRGTLTFTRGSGGALRAVDTLGLELYVRAVVSIECPGTWRQAALRAQAVASRSYVLANLRPHSDFDVYPDDRSQNYRGMSRELPAATAATAATRHQVLTYGGAVINAFFSASNGGMTSDGQESWGATRLPYLVSRADPFDAQSPDESWGPVSLPLERVQRALPGLTADLSTVDLVRGADGRVTTLTFVAGDGTRSTVDGYAFQQRLGLRSTYFTLAAEYGAELMPAVESAA